MKTLITVLVGVFGLLLAACQAEAQIIATNYSAASPDTTSINFPSYQGNLMNAVRIGVAHGGIPGLSSAVFITDTIDPREIISTPGEFSWRGQANPPSPNNQEHGGGFVVGIHIISTDGRRFRPDSFELIQSSTDPFDSFSTTVNGDITSFSLSTWGVTHNGNGSQTVRTNGNIDFIHQFSISYNEAIGVSDGQPNTLQQRIDEALADFGFFDINATWRVRGVYEDGNLLDEIVSSQIHIVPEPSTMAFGAMGLGLIFARLASRKAPS